MTKPMSAVSGDDNAAIVSERVRIDSIINSPEGRRNPAMANKLALYSALDAETAKSILAEAPAANPYLAAMDREGPTGLSAPATEISGDAKAARLKEISENMAAINAANRKAQGLPGKG